MSDATLRAAERALTIGEPGAEEAWVAAHLRSGGRDPRRFPWPGDVVESGHIWYAMPDGEPTRRRTVVLTGASVAVHLGPPAGPGASVRYVRGNGASYKPSWLSSREMAPEMSLASWRRWAKGGRVVRVAR